MRQVVAGNFDARTRDECSAGVFDRTGNRVRSHLCRGYEYYKRPHPYAPEPVSLTSWKFSGGRTSQRTNRIAYFSVKGHGLPGATSQYSFAAWVAIIPGTKHPDIGPRAYYKTTRNESAMAGGVPTRLTGSHRQNYFAELCAGFQIFVRSGSFF
jgi:hypothetical protein